MKEESHLESSKKVSQEDRLRIRKAIINLLETRKEKGLSIISLIPILQNTFSKETHIFREELRWLSNTEEILKITTPGAPIYNLKKYYTNKTKLGKNVFYGLDINPLQFIKEISLLQRGKFSFSENNRITKFAGMFIVEGYSIRENPIIFIECDFIAEKESQIAYVKVEENVIDNNYIHKFYESIPSNGNG